MKRLLIPFLAILVLAGCGGNQPYLIKQEATQGSVGSKTLVVIDDQRPETDINFSYGSMLVFKDNYGIWTLGDKQFAPELPELLQQTLHTELSQWATQPDKVSIRLQRLIIQSNHQADLLQSVSTNGSLGPLGVLIAETMHGKEFELDYDKTRPFVVGLIKAEVQIESADKTESRNLFLSKIENFPHHMDFQGREKAAINVAKSLTAEFASSIR